MVTRQLAAVLQFYTTAVTAHWLLLLQTPPTAAIASADNSTSITSITAAGFTGSSNSSSVLTAGQTGDVYDVIDHVQSTTSGHNLDALQSDQLTTAFVPRQQFLDSISAADTEMITSSVFAEQSKNESRLVNGAVVDKFTSAVPEQVSQSTNTVKLPNDNDVTYGTRNSNNYNTVKQLDVNTTVVYRGTEPAETAAEKSTTTVTEDAFMTSPMKRFTAAWPSTTDTATDDTTLQPSATTAEDDIKKVKVKAKAPSLSRDYMQLLQHRYSIDRDRSLSTFDVHRLLWQDQPYVVLLSALTGISISMLMIFTVYWCRQCTTPSRLLGQLLLAQKNGSICCRRYGSNDQEAALLVDT